MYEEEDNLLVRPKHRRYTPSSSGRSAELLGNESSFFSFNSLKDISTNSTTLKGVGTEFFDNNLDPNLQVILKKMGKKDATTKHKALLEFVTFCQNSKGDEINAVLPVWIRIYSSLILDSENRVREATQLAHKALATSVGRNLAPFLKQVAPYWIISQYDTYPPAASAATTSFQEVFPPKKMTDVIVFCQEEILNYISDNLINQTPLSLGKAESISEEEKEARYQRLIASSLYGYALYLKMLPPEKLSDALEANKELVSSSKFWNFCKHKSPGIRAAWYSALISLCQSGQILLEGIYKNAVTAVFSNLDEPDPCVLPVVWEATLHVLIAIKEWWQHLNTGKLVFPKLFNILCKGGQGNAHLIYPHLLPLLSNIPSDIIGDRDVFYKKFFSSLRTGMKQQSVTQSPSESEAVASTYIECIRYLIMIHNSDDVFCIKLFQENLMDLLSKTMEEPMHRLIINPFYQGLTQMVSFYHQNHTKPIFETILQDFWMNLPLICLRHLENFENEKDILAHVFNCQIQLFSCCKNPNLQKKKNMKVKFTSSSDNEAPIEEKKTEITIQKSDLSPEMSKNLVDIIELLTQKYLSIATNSTNNEVRILSIKQMWNVVKIIESEKLILCMIPSEEKFSSILGAWLKDDKIPLEPLLGLIFNAVDHMEDTEFKNRLLNELSEIRLKEAISVAVTLTRNEKETPIQSWLRSDAIRNTLCNFIVDLAHDNKENSIDVLNNCLTTMKDNEFAIGNSTVSAILKTLVTVLQSGENYNSELIASVLEVVFSNDKASFFRGEHSDVVFQLLWIIFEKLIMGKIEDMFEVWKKGIAIIVKIYEWKSNVFISHTNLCASSVVNYLVRNEGKTIECLRRLCYTVHCFISGAIMLIDEKERSDATMKLSEIFISSVFKNARDLWEVKLRTTCLQSEQIFGNIMFPEICTENYLISTNGKWDPLGDIHVSSYSQSIMFCVKLIMYLLDICDGKDDTSFTSANDIGPLIKLNEIRENFITDGLLNYTYSLTLLKTIANFYKSTSQYFESAVIISILEKDLKELLQLVDETKQKEIIELAQSNARKTPESQWSQTVDIICKDFLDMEDVGTQTDDVPEDVSTQLSLLLDIHLLRIKIQKNKKTKYSNGDVRNLIEKISKERSKESSVAFDKYLGDLEPYDFALSAEIARFFTEVIRSHKEILNDFGWDFVMIATASWVQSISKTEAHKYYNEFLGFLTAVCDLFLSFNEHINSNEDDDDNLKTLKKEWKDVFSFDVHRIFSVAWKILAEKCSACNLVPTSLLHIEKLSEVLTSIIESGTFLPTPPNTSCVLSWIKNCSSFIISSCPAVQITSFKIFMHIAPLMLDIDSGIDESCCSKLSCSLIKEPFSNTQTVVKTMLQDFRLGIICSVKPYTDGYTYTRAYMLLWLVLLKMCKLGDSQLRYLYTLWIKENDVLSVLMENLLRLMPEPVIHLLEVNVRKTQDYFVASPPLTYDGWNSQRLGHLCCWVYCTLLRTLPALARQWVVDAESKMATLIDKLTIAFVSPILCNEEMEHIKQQDKKFDNMKIYTHSIAREVVAVYTVEDCTTELIIQLMPNHPLTPPKVDISKVMVSSNKTRNLLMQLTIFLTHQNGNIWDGLNLWKSNLDKKFEGIEECYICFSILHNTNHQLPKLSCQTCKKKFHSICLYKWFTTSNKSTCPICRNLF